MATTNPQKESKPILVIIHAERRMLPDGTLIYSPLHTAEAGHEVNTHDASKLAGLSVRQIQHLCDTGFYETARRKSQGKRSQWIIQRREVLANRYKSKS